VLFSSDNGGTGRANNGGLRGGKAGMYEGGLRVPLIAHWPGRIPRDRVVDDFATTLELFPTLLSVAGGKPPSGVKLDGHDLTPVFEGKGKSRRREMFWYKTFTNSGAARVDNWKWVSNAAKEELYDLGSDPGEQKDLAADKPEVLAKVKGRYEAWQKEMEAVEPRGPFRNY
jgi:arylsulfatase A-like enzyme